MIIDISYYQDPSRIDYDVLALAVDGVILRAAYGTQKDTAFEAHYAEFSKRAVPMGAYHFIVQFATAEAQVEVMAKALAGKKLALGRWCDVELETGAEALTAAMVTKYMSLAETRLGRFDIYTGKWCWQPIMGEAYGKYSSRKLWCSSYTKEALVPPGWNSWWLWQYTSNARLPGYGSDLDASHFFGGPQAFAAWANGTAIYPEKLFSPLAGDFPITQLFGKNPSWYPTSRGHNGIDFGTPVGTPAYAMQGGTVVRAAEFSQPGITDGKVGYGRHVRIEHPEGVSIYGHFSQLFVKEGDQVAAMQMIGLTGGATSDPHSGFSTGPHLHAEYRLNAGAPQVPGGYSYGAIDLMPLLVPHNYKEETMLFQGKCVVAGLRMRSSPAILSGNVVGAAVSGQIYPVFETTGDWWRISDRAQQWVLSKLGSSVYMEKVGAVVDPLAEVSDAEKLARLWAAHKELHV